MPEAEKFDALSSASKYLLDTIKMVAYRAETAMVNIIRKTMSRPDDGRKLLKAIYSTEADILPDEKNGTLTVNLHHLANHCSDDIIVELCNELNSTNTVFPGTKLRLIFNMGSTQNP